LYLGFVAEKRHIPEDAWGQRTGKSLAELEFKTPSEIHPGSLKLDTWNRILVIKDTIQASAAEPSTSASQPHN
jgi:hypothetical protein